MQKKCYYCNKPIDLNNDHSEHIIPNGIGGKLQSKGILCISCGGILGDKVYLDFCTNFSEIQNFIQIKKDRKTSTKPHQYTVKLDDLEIVASLKENHLTPANYLRRHSKSNHKMGVWQTFLLLPIQPLSGFLQAGLGKMKIGHGCFQVGVAHVTLNNPDIDAGFQQMGYIRMAEGVDGSPAFNDTGSISCLAKGSLGTAFGHRFFGDRSFCAATAQGRKEQGRIFVSAPICSEEGQR